MRRIANDKKPGRDQLVKPINFHRKKTDLVPVTQLADAVAQERLQSGNVFAKLFNPALANLVRGALRDEQSHTASSLRGQS